MSEAGALLVTLITYKVLLLGIGLWAARRNRDGTDFYLGGRGLGAWVASLSAAASSSSAWTLLGVSGAAYQFGLSAAWLLPACMGGFALNWFLVARRMRAASRETDAVTVVEFLAHGAPHRLSRALTVSGSVIVLASLGVYVASQFQGAGKTFAETLGWDFRAAVLAGGTIILLYTMAGGFWAVSVSDALQGLVMAAACLLVPAFALVDAGGWGGITAGLRVADPGLLDPWRGHAGLLALAFVVGTLGIGLGYPGQPHVINRFMALRSEKDVRRGTWISLGWAAVVYSGMLIAGWAARARVAGAAAAQRAAEGPVDAEASLLWLTTELFPTVFAGVIVAAVLSAIMSTADSQLLVCGSTVAHDLPHRAGSRRVALDRATIVGLSLAAMVAALLIDETIFHTVLFAWSGVGAAFGPLILVRLLVGPVRPRWALAAMWSGFAVTGAWFFTPALKDAMYELVPAFAVAGAIALAGARPTGGVSPARA